MDKACIDNPKACPNCKRYDWDKIANASLPLGK